MRLQPEARVVLFLVDTRALSPAAPDPARPRAGEKGHHLFPAATLLRKMQQWHMKVNKSSVSFW